MMAIAAVLVAMMIVLGFLRGPSLPVVRVTVQQRLTPVQADNLYIAISDGDVQKVMRAVEADPTLLRRWKFGDYGLLTQAASFRRHDLVTALLQMGADPNADKGAALFYAVDSSESATAIALLRAGADPHVKNKYGGTPLETAEDNGLTEVVNVMRGLPSKAATTRPASE